MKRVIAQQINRASTGYCDLACGQGITVRGGKGEVVKTFLWRINTCGVNSVEHGVKGIRSPLRAPPSFSEHTFLTCPFFILH